MFFQQYYLECLSHASYMVGDTTTGHAAVVDPQRDIQQYLDDARTNGLTITKVIETHCMAAQQKDEWSSPRTMSIMVRIFHWELLI